MKIEKLTPQPVSIAVLIEPSLRLINLAISSIYASAPLGNMVPPPGNLNFSPSYLIQFCTAFSTVNSLCGTFAYHTRSLLVGQAKGFLYPNGAGMRHFNVSLFAGQCLSLYINLSLLNLSDLLASSHGVYSLYLTLHGG